MLGFQEAQITTATQTTAKVDIVVVATRVIASPPMIVEYREDMESGRTVLTRTNVIIHSLSGAKCRVGIVVCLKLFYTISR